MLASNYFLTSDDFSKKKIDHYDKVDLGKIEMIHKGHLKVEGVLAHESEYKLGNKKQKIYGK